MMKKTITRTLGVLVLLAVLAALVVGCSDMITSLTGIDDTPAGADAAALTADDITFASGDTAEAVSGNFTLPITGEVNTTTTIAWESGNTDVITVDNTTGNATVTRPADADAAVTLTATLTDAEENTSTKTVTVTVVAGGDVISASGILDTSFNASGTTPGVVVHVNAAGGAGHDSGRDVLIDPDGKILVCGYSSNTTPNRDMVLWRYNSNGTLDTSFGTNGIVTQDGAAGEYDDGYSIALDSSGNILVTGESKIAADRFQDMVIWRYDSNGTLDTSFSDDGIVTHQGAADKNSYGFSIAIDDSTGKILVAGESEKDNGKSGMTLWSYNIAGTLDTTFGGGAGFVTYDNGNAAVSDFGQSIAIDSTGKILVAGSSVNTDGVDKMTLWRYDSGGNPDTSFGVGGTVTQTGTADGSANKDEGKSIAIDSEGNILVAGKSYDSNVSGYVMTLWRYNSAGILDASFGGGDGFVASSINSEGMQVRTDPNGKILVAGYSYADAISSDPGMALWRYNSDGTPDADFGGGDGFITHHGAAGGGVSDWDWGSSVALDDPDGKILVTGGSTNSSGDSDMAIWRYE